MRLRLVYHAFTFPSDDPARQFVNSESNFSGQCMLTQDFNVGLIGAVSIGPGFQDSQCQFDNFAGVHID